MNVPIRDISTHTLTWSVTVIPICYLLYLNYFNSHAHVERDFHTLQWSIGTCNFNSHAHVERDTRFTDLALYYTNFNSHAHVERDPEINFRIANNCNFNSHAHVERDINIFKVLSFLHISTHTLTWSVTVENDSWKLTSGQFQLTRSRGAWR